MQGGKGRKRGGGGGGDGGEGAFDWRAWVQDFVRGTGKGLRSVGQAGGALLLLLAIFYGASLVKPAAAAGMAAVRWLLRLDGRGSRRVRAWTISHPFFSAPPHPGLEVLAGSSRKCACAGAATCTGADVASRGAERRRPGRE
jgi:hypothetical protein